MKYKDFIEDYFLIDEPKTGKLVPFIFNEVQQAYYQQLCDDYDIEKEGIGAPIRDIILKARREGFSSLILGLFAADDILNPEPTETQVISYKDDATRVFSRRYKNFIKSYWKKRFGVTDERRIFKTQTKTEFTHRENDAHFLCGTASARTGERGGVLQKLLFSEAAHYPDTENMTAKEIIEGSLRQVDIHSGWVFVESTANGIGNHYHKMWKQAETESSRFNARFYGWREFYTESEFELIKSEFTDKSLIPQEYPETPEEAFVASVKSFTSADSLHQMTDINAPKRIHSWLELQGTNYIEQAEIISTYLRSLENSLQRSLYVGIDVAKISDSTVVTVLEGQDFGHGKVQAIAIDSTGIGDYLPDWFEKNSRWFIIPIKMSAPQKDTMYKNLQAVIARRLTEIPERSDDSDEESARFWEQMLSLQSERRNASPIMRIRHPEGGHDDYPDSWALAEMAYVEINGKPQLAKKPEKPSDAVKAFLEGKYNPTSTEDLQAPKKTFE